MLLEEVAPVYWLSWASPGTHFSPFSSPYDDSYGQDHYSITWTAEKLWALIPTSSAAPPAITPTCNGISCSAEPLGFYVSRPIFNVMYSQNATLLTARITCIQIPNVPGDHCVCQPPQVARRTLAELGLNTLMFWHFGGGSYCLYTLQVVGSHHSHQSEQ